MATVITMKLTEQRCHGKNDVDHTQNMLRNPAGYGFLPDEIPALTQEELRRGVTKQQLIRYGEWLYAKAVKDRKIRDAIGWPRRFLA